MAAGSVFLGSSPPVKSFIQILLLFLLHFQGLAAQQEDCCKTKIVEGVGPESGRYSLTTTSDSVPDFCLDKCVYSKEADPNPGTVYCFKLGWLDTACRLGTAREIAPGVYTFTVSSQYISLFVVTGAGVVAIEPVSVSYSSAMIQAIRDVTDEPIKYIIHTHDHWDHGKGNGIWREEEAKIVAHSEAVASMKAHPHPDIVIPDTVWSGDMEEIILGNTTIKLLYMGINHGQGMTVIHIPEHDLVYTGDLVTPKRLLFTIVPDFNIREWERTLEEIISIDFSIGVYSHTYAEDPLAAGSKQDTIDQLQYIRDLRDALHAELAAGTPFAQVPYTVRVPKYESWGFYDQWLYMNAWRLLLDDVMGPYPWRDLLNQELEGNSSLTSVSPSLVSESNGTAREIGPGVYTFTVFTGYISLFVVTGDGVVAIEPASVSQSSAMIQAIRDVTDEPIKYIIHTHDHWDHGKGNGIWREEGAKIVAHSEAVASMKAHPHPEIVIPDTVWSGDEKEIILGNTTIKLLYMGINHGQGMTVIHIPEHDLVYTGDLVTPKRVLFAIVPDFNIREWERTLEEIISIDFSIGVYSHTNAEDPLAAGSKQDTIDQLQFIRDLRDALHAELAAGTPFGAVPNAVRLPKYETWGLYEEFLHLNAWRLLLDDVMGPYPWRDLSRKGPGIGRQLIMKAL